MKKMFCSFAVLVLFALVFVASSQAQLINYERRNKAMGIATPQASTSASTYQSRAAAADTSRQVTNRTERRYDRNRDGKLQPDEIKRYLADVISTVQSRGRYVIDSEILRSYDTNSDGRISRYELGALRQAAR